MLCYVHEKFVDRLENFRGGITLIGVSGVAGVAQLVERHLAKVAVDGSSPFARSNILGRREFLCGLFLCVFNGAFIVRGVAEWFCR